jgi:23S rRNA pseudouridine2605 synthase
LSPNRSRPPQTTRKPRQFPQSTPSPRRTPEGGEPERLQKLLAAAGLGSRREVEGWISAGRVSIDGRVARLGERAGPANRVCVDGRQVALRAAATPVRVILYHKPVGELVTRRDPGGRPTVFEHLPRLPGGKWAAVGRLDLNTSGLLLFTDSGELANRLMHPRYEVLREYSVRALGRLGSEQRRRLLSGVELEDGTAAFERVDAQGEDAGANRWYRVALREGRNREVRRLFEAVGLRVNRLVRTGYGPVYLPRDLEPGQWRELEPRRVRELLSTADA